MFRSLPLLFVLLFTSGISLAQQNSPTDHWNAFYANDFSYFFGEENDRQEDFLYHALRADLGGDLKESVTNLERAIEDESFRGESRDRATSLLFDKYLEQRDFAAAIQLATVENLEDKNLKYVAWLGLQEAPTFRGEGTTSVPFDGFYVKAKIGQDSALIFLDTGAPGITIDARWCKKNGWPRDTSQSGNIVEPYLGLQYATYPTVIERLQIGTFTFGNLPAKAVELTDEQWERKTSSGIKRYDIIMGLEAFYGLIDGVAFDYDREAFRLIASLPEKDQAPNFQRVEGKPAVTFTVNDGDYSAFVDTGSPRHVFTKSMLANINIIDSYTDAYGSYEYQVSSVMVDELLNLDNVLLEVADYARPTSGKDFNISVLLGSFYGRCLKFDLKNRIVSLTDEGIQGR